MHKPLFGAFVVCVRVCVSSRRLAGILVRYRVCYSVRSNKDAPQKYTVDAPQEYTHVDAGAKT